MVDWLAFCLARSRRGLVCSRTQGHAGPHRATGTDGRVLQEWCVVSNVPQAREESKVTQTYCDGCGERVSRHDVRTVQRRKGGLSEDNAPDLELCWKCRRNIDQAIAGVLAAAKPTEEENP